MNKFNKNATLFLQKNKNSPLDNSLLKNEVAIANPYERNSFKGIFGEGKLTEEDNLQLQQILSDYFEPGVIKDDQVNEDFQSLTRLTSEVKAINQQSVLLHGVRIKKAQELLANYKNGAFSQWLTLCYGNRQTPYSHLRYYELYNSMPTQEQDLIANIPKKAAYLLACRDDVSIDRKMDFIKKYKDQSQKDIISLIQELFPLKEGDKRKHKPLNQATLDTILELTKKLEKRKKYLLDEDFQKISQIINSLSSLQKIKNE